MNSEHLSIAVNEELGIVGITIRGKKFVHFWNIRTREFLAQVAMPSPKGIYVDPKNGEFVVATNTGLHSVHPINFRTKSLGFLELGNGLAHFDII